MTNSINVKFLPKINLAKSESADSVTRILQSQSTNFLITPCKKALTFASHAGNRRKRSAIGAGVIGPQRWLLQSD